MTEELKPAKSKKVEDSKEEVIKEQMKKQYGTYIFIFAIIYFCSWIVVLLELKVFEFKI